MENVRRAEQSDVSRIAEIMVFNYRLNFYRFFKNDPFYFGELNVLDTAKEFADDLSGVYVYDDGVVCGFIRAVGDELVMAAFLRDELGVRWLWALEYNTRGISFYKRHGFELTGEKMTEDEWVPLVKLALGKEA